MSNEQKTPPSTFYRMGDLHPIKMTFLCDFPYPTPVIYAVYLNCKTKQPERVHLPTIVDWQLNHETVYTRILNMTRSRLNFIVDTMNSLNYEIPDEKKSQNISPF
jgi:hypothetical protein